MREIVRIRGGGALAPKQAQFIYNVQLRLPDKVRQSKGWLFAIVCCSTAKTNDLWDESVDKRKVRGLVPCLFRIAIKYHNIT